MPLDDDDRRRGPAGAGLPPADPGDPVFAPIDGVTIDQYAHITAALARRPRPAEERDAWLRAQGVDAGTWADVQAGWVQRMTTSDAVRTRYGILFAQG